MMKVRAARREVCSRQCDNLDNTAIFEGRMMDDQPWNEAASMPRGTPVELGASSPQSAILRAVTT